MATAWPTLRFQPLGMTTEANRGAVWILFADQNQPPEAICQDVTVPTEPGVCSVDASVDDGSFDPDGDEITLEQTPPGPYDFGDTDVTLTVTVDKGASDTCEATVTVVDEEAPVISSVSTSPNKLWPPNHKFVPVVLTVDASDNCDSTCQIISVEMAVINRKNRPQSKIVGFYSNAPAGPLFEVERDYIICDTA